MVHFIDPAAPDVEVRAGRDVPAAVANRSRRKVALALGRLARHVRTVRVRLTDTNGAARGGLDKQCVVAIRLAGHPRLLVIEDIDRDWQTAIDRAADRAARSLARVAHAFFDRGSR